MKRWLLLLSVVGLAGCAGKQTESPSTSAARHNGKLKIIVVDVSGSTAQGAVSPSRLHEKEVAQAFDLGQQVGLGDELEVFAFANSTREVFSGHPPDEDEYGQILQRELAVDPTPRTNYPLMLETVASAVKESTAEFVSVSILGDGLNDFTAEPKMEKRYAAAANALADDPRVTEVVIWGVASRSRSELRHVFASLQNRLVIQSDAEELAVRR